MLSSGEIKGRQWSQFLAAMVWSMSEFPRWLTGSLAFNGIVGLAYCAFMMGKYEPPVLSEILLIFVFFAMAGVFWRGEIGGQAGLKPA